ncbi:MAG: hypothetical protein WA294_01610 [Acidobacteriaceae bacterium]
MEPIEESKLESMGASARCPQAEQMEAASGAAPPPRRLHSREDLLMLLNLNDEQVQFLTNTRQITAIRIAGEERYDSRDIDRLIESYKATAQRRIR